MLAGYALVRTLAIVLLLLLAGCVPAAEPDTVNSTLSPTSFEVTPSEATTSPSAPSQQARDKADAKPAVVDLTDVALTAEEEGLVVTWTAARNIPEEPTQRLYYALSVERFDDDGNGDAYQVAASWPGDGWAGHVFNFEEGQTALDPPEISGRSITVLADWDLIGGRVTFDWSAASEAGDDINNDEVKGREFVLT